MALNLFHGGSRSTRSQSQQDYQTLQTLMQTRSPFQGEDLKMGWGLFNEPALDESALVSRAGWGWTQLRG